MRSGYRTCPGCRGVGEIPTGKLLREIRHRAGFRLSDVARELGLSLNSWSFPGAIERDEKAPTADVIDYYERLDEESRARAEEAP